MGSTYSNERNLSHSPLQQDETLERTMTCTLDCVHFAEVLAKAYMIYVSIQLVDLRFQLTLLPPFRQIARAFNHRGVVARFSGGPPEEFRGTSPANGYVQAFSPARSGGQTSNGGFIIVTDLLKSAVPRFITIESREGALAPASPQHSTQCFRIGEHPRVDGTGRSCWQAVGVDDSEHVFQSSDGWQSSEHATVCPRVRFWWTLLE
jgi:hypothetical protein